MGTTAWSKDPTTRAARANATFPPQSPIPGPRPAFAPVDPGRSSSSESESRGESMASARADGREG